MAHTLTTQLDDTVSHLSTIAPPDLFAVFATEQKRLAASDDASDRIAVGDHFPEVSLPNAAGASVPVLGTVPTVIVFYRGAWCPYCNVALGVYQREVLPVLEGAGVGFVAISPQGPDGSLSIADANGLTFPVLTDKGGELARSLGIGFELTDDVREAQLAFGNDFTEINAGGEWALPRPTVIVVDSRRVVTFVDVQPDYSRRTEPAAILLAVKELSRR